VSEIDAQSLREALDYYDRYLAFRQRFQRVPGVQAAVFADGDVQLSVAHGKADLASGAELTTQSLFRIASHSKTFAATVLAQLVEQGALRLDDTVAHWVPELVGTGVAGYTVRDLLQHSTGIFRDGPDGDHWQLFRPFPDRARLLEILAGPTAPVLAVNERFKYSNMGYSLLGLVIQAVSGQTFNERVAAEVAGRLGLSDLGAEYDPTRAADYASGYTALSYADERVPIEHVDTRAMAAATGCFATASDLVRYFAAHLPGDDRLLSEDSKRLLHHGWWDVTVAKTRYGLGFSVTELGDRTMFGHGGGYPGHITSTVADPEAGLVVSVLTNAIDGPAGALAHAGVKLLDLAAGKPRGDVTESAFVGRWASLWGVQDIAVLGGRLYLMDPAAAEISEDAAVLEVVDDRTVRLAGGSGFGSYGEELTLEEVEGQTRLRGESGMTSWRIEDFALPERVQLGWTPDHAGQR
jgi:CubicO group peptidase (beta-lactamase class C family)